jgi:hypothetical protein
MSATLEQINRLAAELLECYLELSELIRRGAGRKRPGPLSCVSGRSRANWRSCGSGGGANEFIRMCDNFTLIVWARPYMEDLAAHPLPANKASNRVHAIGQPITAFADSRWYNLAEMKTRCNETRIS